MIQAAQRSEVKSKRGDSISCCLESNFVERIAFMQYYILRRKSKSEYVVEFYRKENGDSPVEEFIDSLDVKHQGKALRVISLLKAYGNTLREPYWKPLIDGIFELRTSLGSDTMRILYFFSGGKIIVLTNGFVKKTQKTPRGEIETARKYKEDWIERRK